MISEHPFFPEQPSAAGRQIELCFKLWRHGGAACFLPLLIPALLAILPGLLFAPAELSPYAGVEFDSDTLSRPSYWCLWAVIFVASVLGQVVAVLRLQARADCLNESWSRSMERGLQRLPAALGAYALYLLVLALSLAPWIALLIWLVGQPFSGAALALFLLSTCLLWLLPTWFSLAGVFFLYTSSLDGAGPVASIRSSLALIRGHWWHTSAVVGVVLLAYTGILLVAMPLCMSLALGASYLTHGPEALLSMQWLPGFQLLFAPIHAVSLGLVFATGLVCFHDLRSRRGG